MVVTSLVPSVARVPAHKSHKVCQGKSTVGTVHGYGVTKGGDI